jgi:hypothetical protein
VNRYAQALALLDSVQEAGCELLMDEEGLALDGELVGPLSAALSAFCGFGEHRAALSEYRALVAVLQSPTRAVREIHALPVVHAKIPGAAYAVQLDRKGVCSTFTVSRRIYDRESAAARPVWRWPELEAMARAHEAGRLTPMAFDAWVAAKLRGSWSLSPELAGCLPGGDHPEPQCTFGELAEAVGAQITAVEWESEAAA